MYQLTINNVPTCLQSNHVTVNITLRQFAATIHRLPVLNSREEPLNVINEATMPPLEVSGTTVTPEM